MSRHPATQQARLGRPGAARAPRPCSAAPSALGRRSAGASTRRKLTLENISQLTGLEVDDLAAALDDPRSIPTEKKYALAIKGSYFINAVNQARRN